MWRCGMKYAYLETNQQLKWRNILEAPEGFIVKGQEYKVCKLVKCLYSLKHAPK